MTHCFSENDDNIYVTSVYRVSHELRSLLRESVPYVKVYRYNPKYLYPKLNGFGDNGKRKMDILRLHALYVSASCNLCPPCVGCHVTEFLLMVASRR